MNKDQLAEILNKHRKWRRGEEGGERAYLADANLEGANLADPNLEGANLAELGVFQGTREEWLAQRSVTDAERAERYRARHPEVPVVANMDARIWEEIESGGQLDMADWHVCSTTHCRAGWAIHLAGKAGYELEKEYGPRRAGSMIYRASTGRVPHFFATTLRALDDIRACAAAHGAAGSGGGR